MDNITILKNFPTAVMDAFYQIYGCRFKGRPLQHQWTPEHAASVLESSDLQFLNQFLPLPAHMIELYYISGTALPHIDRGRKTALQIPIDIDLENSFIFSVKDKDLSNLLPVQDSSFTPRDVVAVNDPPNWFYRWNEALFDKYNLEYPVLHNVAMPHGTIHSSARKAIFFSVTYKDMD